MKTNDRIQIRVSDDGLEAWVDVREGPKSDRDELMNQLAAAGIVAGIDDEAIDGVTRALALETAMLQERRVARGVPAQAGTPSTLQLDDPAGPIAGLLLPDGRLDFRERQLIVPVAEGNSIGHILPAVEGKAGSDVRGQPIPPPTPEKLVVKHGDGIEIDEEGNLIAARTGARTIDSDGSIDVVEHHVHSGDVDLKSGNLKSGGSLEISRDVTVNMSARSLVDLKVGGSVDGGSVEAGGSIEIVGGAIGRTSGSVRSAGDVLLRHALGARIYARGRICVSQSVSTSQLMAKEIEVGGAMLSDSAHAESRIILKDAGSPAGGPCILHAAHPLEPKDSDPKQGQVAGERPRRKSCSSDGSLRDRKGRGTRPTMKAQLEARREWRRRQRELQRTAVIEIRGTAYAGCRLDFGVAPLVLEKTVSARRFSVNLETDEIVSVEI
ncbi:MAG: DUF342 domain-containing protein [Deltaproteobacteria bacterium]|nr:DUF342 domain-containing protein [Deltaproteobacteria bacterium]MBW2394856.1 DUF342 domain-containing protein [Deltaproteobacteria bacterium]